MYTRGHGWVAEPARITDFTVAVNRVSVTVPTAVSVGSKVDIVCSWDNGDNPPRHPVVRLTGGGGTEKTGLKLTETSQNQKKSTQQTNKKSENNVLKVTIPFCFVGHIHEVKSQPLTGERL